MEEQKDVNVNLVLEQDTKSGALNTITPIQEKLTDIEKFQDMVIPEVVKEIAEVIIPAAAVAAGDKEVKPEEVKVKKPTKSDPIIMYGNNVVMWYIET